MKFLTLNWVEGSQKGERQYFCKTSIELLMNKTIALQTLFVKILDFSHTNRKMTAQHLEKIKSSE